MLNIHLIRRVKHAIKIMTFN